METRVVEVNGMRIEYDVPIPMDDGVVLRADVFRPAAEGRYPVLLSYGPYAKGLPFQLGYPRQWSILVQRCPEVSEGSSCRYQNWEVEDPEKWVPEGYICVRVDSRGAGRSPGVLDIFSPRETRDLYQCIEWAAAQPWSNGRVGLSGISYYAINQWLVAGLQPPHLTAMCAWEGAADFYRDWNRHGGILCTFTDSWFRGQVIPVQHGQGARGFLDPVTGEWVAGPETLPEEMLARNRVDSFQQARWRELDDEWYRARSADWSRVKVPFLSAGNWGGHGLHLRGNVEAFVQAASTQKWLEIHGLEHWTLYYSRYGYELRKRFFDYFLKGVDNGWDKEARVLLNVRHVDGFEFRKENEWPLARTRWTRLYLNPAGRLLAREPARQQSFVEYEAFGKGVTFRTPPFEQETEITGPLAAKLFISSTAPDADLFLILQLFDPEGREVTFTGALDPRAPLAQGWLRASHRKLDPERSLPYRPYHTHDELQWLIPGQIYEVDVEIWPTSIVIPPGYTLTLTIQGKDFEREETIPGVGPWAAFRGSGPFLHNDPWDRRPERVGGRVRIYGGGETPSFLLLPVIPRG
ncbi:Putative serine esterase [Candidatus Thermoflexus japonica]|uniref:Serine esterase n=1 Tax=Candidatus Thermoflexus japonica TaxID=2035417 RepID=A0A2H5Y577_9CHLR|nr:Putative serine esterase [Candidatus Thermoflexus japonica]